ncbi:GNAT family N-acetyltransferase [Catellatospora sp. KI3]|uniref:GNAT family N-acetyltransferase n=1 Tax=Catellatospora sp. KI3 TaxID=3041620 RepID=UPI002482BF1E|nr:GNAT family N-acetyltransferase [Catellatospora sp. KI3]MDI1461509.1 GNAT family N-acetyltransferase [Catellatospora sp. KI3]
MRDIMLRAAGADDGPAIAAVQQTAWRATYGDLNPAMVDGLDPARTADNWARAAADPARRLRLAERDAKVVGYALSGPAESEPPGVGELDAVYLLPAAHGLGAGRLLVEDALTSLAGLGCDECVAWVVAANTRARGFYEHVGFRPDGGRGIWRGLNTVRYRASTTGARTKRVSA